MGGDNEMKKVSPIIQSSDNAHLPGKRKYHCTADPLFKCIAFSSFANIEINNRFTWLVIYKAVKLLLEQGKSYQ